VVVTVEASPWRGARLYVLAAQALASLPVQSVIVGPPDLVPDPPDRMVVVPRASLRALVRRAAVVVCDGGQATVDEALAHGVPLVVAPLVGDQPAVARQVVRAGAGVSVAADLVDGARLARAVTTALTDRGIRRGVRRLHDSFARTGGAVAAGDRLEALLGARAVSRNEPA
jgi:UDP:flavonoid glycosyltransferase YjiC (YdhE family)